MRFAALRRLGFRKPPVGLRPLWCFAPPQFYGCWNASRSSIATAKPSHTAGTLCAMTAKLVCKYYGNNILTSNNFLYNIYISMDKFGLYNNRKCNLLLFIVTILSILFIIFSIIIVERIKPLGELLFFKQFIIFSILFLIILPTLMIIIGNVYFKLTNKKEWFSWFKVPEYYDDLFRIISIFPLLFIMFEIAIFFGYYGLFKNNEILFKIIFVVILGILFVYSHIIYKYIYRLK
jgi:uncharacterized BrkB/YihY/UPF0761 family membrane protein